MATGFRVGIADAMPTLQAMHQNYLSPRASFFRIQCLYKPLKENQK
jgi:hypothetical protein